MIYEITVDGISHRVEVEARDVVWSCRVDGEVIAIDAVLVEPDLLSLRVGGNSIEVRREMRAGELKIWVEGRCHAVEARDPRSLRGRKRAADDQGPRWLTAPMPGKVVRVLVQTGDQVEAGAGIMVVEAMKMQNEVKSPKKGIVQKILVAAGSAVNAGDVLAVVE
jgi:biotin carboxyl carrier protein